MAGVDRHTGKVIDNYSSALQSIEVVFATRIGERVMRRDFGGGLAELLGRAMTPPLFAAWKLLLAVAIDTNEPRLRVREIQVRASPDNIMLGRAGIAVLVDWRPRALHGDFTVESIRNFTIRLGERVSIA